MNITFLHQSAQYTLLSLTCKDSFQVTLNSIGASIRSIGYTDSAEKFKNIALSFASDSDYTGNTLYAGATLGPCAGRISNGWLSLPAKKYHLTRNEKNRHCLHSGIHSVSFINWTLVSVREEDTCAEALFQCTLPDCCDGFPGNRTFSVSYLLNEAHELTVRYRAVSDKTTYFNMSNHSYFNLSGNFEESVYDHLLQIHAHSYIYNDDEFIPEGIAPVENSPFDFRKPVSLTRQMKAFSDNAQLTVSHGYNHAFLLNKNNELPQLVFTSPDSAKKLFISSDAPCVVVYSGGFIESGLPLSGNQISCPGCAAAFEFQDYPDAPGNHGFPFHYTEAGKEWTRYIKYSFVFHVLQKINKKIIFLKNFKKTFDNYNSICYHMFC